MVELTEGRIVAEHYKLLKQLGQGSFGVVWLAHNLLADIDVAIKFYGSLDEQGLEDLRNEFKIAYQLNHPNLLNVSHFDVTENCPYLVMPYCPNGSVRRFAGKMAERDIWGFIRDVASGLAFLHSQYPPIVHQDIKPDNILITADGRYVISDFGISRSIHTRMSRTVNSFSSSGTIAYMGPERFSETPKMILASDVWALGMTIHEVATGCVLWEGMGGCVQLNGARIPKLDSQFSPELGRLMEACLDPLARNRPTASEVQEYATAMIEGRPLPLLNGQQAAVQPWASVYPKPSPSPCASVYPKPFPSPLPPSNWQSAASPSPQPASAYRSDRSSSHTETPQKEKLSVSGKINAERLGIAAFILLALFAVCTGIYIFIDLNSGQYAEKPHIQVNEPTAIQQQPSTLVEQDEESPGTAGGTESQGAMQNTAEETCSKEETAPRRAAVNTYHTTTASPLKTQLDNTRSGNTSRNTKTEEERFFSQCKTAADYNLYLSKYPNGRHRAEAKAALRRFQQQYDRINSQLPDGGRRSYRRINNANLD